MLSKPSEVAKLLGVSNVTVYKAIHAGRFAAVRVFCGTGPLRVFADVTGKPLNVPPAPGKTKWTPVTTVARLLRVSPRLVQRACTTGLIEARQLPGGLQWRVRFDRGTYLPIAPRDPQVNETTR